MSGWGPLKAALEMAGGSLIVALVLYDVFQSVLVPRWTARTLRIAPLLIYGLWPVWRAFGLRVRASETRENFLSAFAPLVVTLILVVWVIALIFGYGLALYALRAQIHPPLAGPGTAFYLAGTALFTLGFGDIVAFGGAARAVLLADAASGLAVVALVISFVFTLHGSFLQREILVLTLDERGGSPPSGVTLLETYAKYGLRDGLPALFAAWETWSAEVLESHRAQAILPYFRSAHINESWISALGAVLDAATLLLTAVDGGPYGAAHMMHGLGVHAVLDLSATFGLPRDRQPGVERAEFEQARWRLAQAGYPLRDPDDSWVDFSARRSTYAGPLNEMAKYFATPPSQWIGDRSVISYRHLEETADRPRRKGWLRRLWRR